MIFLFYVESWTVIAEFTECIYDVISVGILITFLGWSYSSSTRYTWLKFLDSIFTSFRSTKTFWNDSFGKLMLVNDEFIAIITKHKIFTLVTFPDFLTFNQSLTAIITKEPIMIFFFFILRSHFFENFLFKFLFSFLSLFSKLVFLLFFLFFSLFSFLSSGLSLLS